MKYILGGAFTAAIITASSAYAEKLPVYEIGIGPGAVYQNYYLGTSDTRSFVFPAIVPVVRGETFKSDEEGARAQLFKDSKYKLDLSVDFNLAIDSEDIALRQGMPDIDSVLQVGPSLQISLDKKPGREWLVRLPLRVGATIGSDFEAAGFTFSPDITYLRDLKFIGNYWLSGYRFLATFTSKNRKRITSWFLRYENLSGAEIEDSPLVEQSGGFTVGFIYSVLLFKSKKLVEVND